VTAAEGKEIMTAKQADGTMNGRLREFFLEEIDAWERGDKASPGCPACGETYARNMRENRKRLLKLLEELDKTH